MITLIAIAMWIALGALFIGMIKYQFITEFSNQDYEVGLVEVLAILVGPITVVVAIFFFICVKNSGSEIYGGWSNPLKNYKGKVQ